MCGYQKFFPLDDGLDFFYSSLKKKSCDNFETHTNFYIYKDVIPHILMY